MYICKLVFHFSLWFKFFAAWFYFLLKCTKERGKKLTGKNLNVDRQFFKDVFCIGVGVVPILRTNCNPFPLFPFINPSLKWKLLYIPSTLFYYNPRPYPYNLILIKYIFSWKSKPKHTGVHITCFLQDAKSSLTKNIESVFWKCLLEPVKYLSYGFLQKKLTTYSRKQFLQKIPP